MILNQFLSLEILQNTIEKETFQNLDFILDILDEEKSIPIFKNIELLGKIHHAVNLDKYSQPTFRKTLFLSVPEQIKNKYFKFCGIKKNISKMTKTEIALNIKKTINFTWGNNEETKKFVGFFDYPDYIIPKDSKKNGQASLANARHAPF